MREVKVFKVGGYDWWAGTDKKSVVDAYNATWPDHIVESDLVEVSESGMRELRFNLETSHHYDGKIEECDFGEYLKILISREVQFPCFFASTEW